VISSTTGLRRSRLARASVLALAVLAAVLVLTVAGAVASSDAVPPPPANPTSADQIQNIDQVKTAIKGYYGDTVTTTPDPVAGTTMLHTYSPTSAYVGEMSQIEGVATKYLNFHAFKGNSGRQAIVFDVDDTTVNTYSYEIYSNFVYNPTTNAAFVNAEVFPPVPGMPALAADAAQHGYAVFFLTGRPESQRTATADNLAKDGYAKPAADHLYLKDQTKPWLSSCAPSCTTTQYKSLTRQHIESLGYDIVASFGDQYSDLNGGFADQTYKLPNPMYFLP
jgi:hypothetical protein